MEAGRPAAGGAHELRGGRAMLTPWFVLETRASAFDPWLELLRREHFAQVLFTATDGPGDLRRYDFADDRGVCAQLYRLQIAPWRLMVRMAQIRAHYYRVEAIIDGKPVVIENAPDICPTIYRAAQQHFNNIAPGNGFDEADIWATTHMLLDGMLRITPTNNEEIAILASIRASVEAELPTIQSAITSTSRGTTTGPHEKTLLKLTDLLRLREQSIKRGRVSKERQTAYDEIGISTNTVKRYARELHDQWDDSSYRPSSISSISSISSK
jgi:hypothetical protein